VRIATRGVFDVKTASAALELSSDAAENTSALAEKLPEARIKGY
jgi:hypothetical protein